MGMGQRMISQVLSEEQVERVHQASLAILERVGVQVPHPEILGRFADAGASGAVLMVTDPSEETLPFSGETTFLDTDGGPAFYAGDPRSLRAAWAS